MRMKYVSNTNKIFGFNGVQSKQKKQTTVVVHVVTGMKTGQK